jgi:hypothetical protein
MGAAVLLRFLFSSSPWRCKNRGIWRVNVGAASLAQAQGNLAQSRGKAGGWRGRFWLGGTLPKTEMRFT